MSQTISSRHLSDQVAERLAAMILSDRMRPGDRLPTVDALCSDFGVSRTVVREALSRLKAEGLVETRQGAGAFVANEVASRPFRLPAKSPEAADAVISVLELRRSVETEAAALAAERRGQSDLHAMRRHLQAMDQAMARGEDGVEHDLAFHRAIATATRNPLFPMFLDFLVQHCRAAIRQACQHGTEWSRFAEEAQREHKPTLDAIERGDADAARKAMWRHLTNGIRRVSTAFP